jgi:hypothetical protein
MSKKLHAAIVEAAAHLRTAFDDRNVGHMTMHIRVSGRVHGEMKIEYAVNEQYDSEVKGASLEAVVEEYFRRKGWNMSNAPLALAAPTMEPVDPVDDARSFYEEPTTKMEF